jgi:hypothetical protein
VRSYFVVAVVVVVAAAAAIIVITLVRSKLEYASVVWNSVMSTDANKLERIQQRFKALCFNLSFLKFITAVPLLWRS